MLNFCGLYKLRNIVQSDTDFEKYPKNNYKVYNVKYCPYSDDSPETINKDINKCAQGLSFDVFEKKSNKKVSSNYLMNNVCIGETIEKSDKEKLLSNGFTEDPQGIKINTLLDDIVNDDNYVIKNIKNMPDKIISQFEIPDYMQVDETLYRGSRPNEKQIKFLKNIMGVSTIINFSVERNRGLSPQDEQKIAEKNGLKYVWIPMISSENPTNEQVNTFFETIDKAKNNNEKVYIHCLYGKDRTGLMTEIYKLKNGISTYNQSLNNLIKRKYNFEENPDAKDFLKQFAIE